MIYIVTNIEVDGSESEMRLHKTTKSRAMSIKFHATGAREHLGFFAEVVTLPISVVGIDRDIKHNMSFSVFENNQRGAVHYSSAGKVYFKVKHYLHIYIYFLEIDIKLESLLVKPSFFFIQAK